MINNLRAAYVLSGFVLFTVPLMPLQWLFVASGSRLARTFPHWYHKQVCKILGVRLNVEGLVVRDRPVLLVSNHVSWLDIVVLSAVAPISFIAKKEVARWPGVSWLAKLQRTVFVDRTRRTKVSQSTGAIAERLRQGDAMVLFAEGTSSDGNQVLPFKSALFAAVEGAAGEGSDGSRQAAAPCVQTLALAYTKQFGLPLGRRGRPYIAWYGDMEMADHMWSLFRRGPIDVQVRVGEPVLLERFEGRKALAKSSEDKVREDVAALLYRGGAGEAPAGAD